MNGPADDDGPSVEDLLQFLHQCPVGLLETDDEGVVRLVNPAAARMLAPLLVATDVDPGDLFAVVGPYCPDLPGRLRQEPRRLGPLEQPFTLRCPGPADCAEDDGATLRIHLVRVEPGRVMVVVLDVTQEARLERQRSEAAHALEQALLARSRAHSEERRLRRRAEIAAHVSAALDGETTVPRRLEALTGALVPALADVAHVELVTGSEPPGPAAAALLARPGVREGLDRVLASGTVQRVDGVLLVPVRARGEVLAVLLLGTDAASGRALDDDDLRLAAEVADRAGLALDNARLAERQQRLTTDLRALQRVTAGIATAATTEEIEHVLLEEGIGLLSPAGVMAVAEPGTGAWRTRPTATVPAQAAVAYARVPAAQAARTPVTYAAASGRPVVLASRAEIAARFPEVVESVDGSGVASILAVPVQVSGPSHAALAFGFADEGAPDEETTSLAQTLADLTGQALQRAALYEAEHRAAHQLQQALLPVVDLDVPGVTIEAAYRPAQPGHDVGGDWYDVFALPGERIGIVVGDVVGHDLHAAVTMSRLQHRLRAAARLARTPGEVLETLDVVATEVEGCDNTTLAYADYHPATGLLRYACAGHPPPLLVTRDAATYLEGGRSTPLGVATGPRPWARTTVEPGALLVCYTDGLVERRDRGIDDGLARLVEVARRLPATRSGGRADLLMSALTDGRPREDDTAVLCLHLGVPPAPLTVARARGPRSSS